MTPTARCRDHPDTAAVAACARCGTFFCAACLQAVDGTWQCASCFARGALLPWDERETLGLWRAWWRTALAMISRPLETLARAQPDGSLGSSLAFAVIASVIGLGPTFALYALVAVPAMMFGGGGDSSSSALPMLLAPVATLLGLGGFFVAQVFGIVVLAAIDHLALLMLGARPKDFSVSVRASALAMSPSVVGLIPVCGLYITPVWSMVLRILALRAFHQTSGGKATAAVLLPTVLLCGGFIALYVFVLAAFFMATAAQG